MTSLSESEDKVAIDAADGEDRVRSSTSRPFSSIVKEKIFFGARCRARLAGEGVQRLRGSTLPRFSILTCVASSASLPVSTAFSLPLRMLSEARGLRGAVKAAAVGDGAGDELRAARRGGFLRGVSDSALTKLRGGR